MDDYFVGIYLFEERENTLYDMAVSFWKRIRRRKGNVVTNVTNENSLV